MNGRSASAKALLAIVVLLAGVSGCTSPGTDQSVSPTPASVSVSSPGTDNSASSAPVSTPESSPDPMAILSSLSAYVASTGVEILDQNLIDASLPFEVTIPDDVTQIGFAAMCESVSQGWTVTVDENEVGWTSPDQCPTQAIFSQIVDVAPLSVVTVQVGLDSDSFLALVTYAANS